MKFLFPFFMFLLSGTVAGQTIHHQLSMPNPETHYFHIQTTLTDFQEDTLVLVMPVWAPGSYKVREFSKNVNQVWAKDENGNNLQLKKVRKNQWQIIKGSANKVTVNYQSYAFEVSVRTAYLDKNHGFVNGVNIFTYPKGYRSLGGTLTVIPALEFKKMTVPLTAAGDQLASDSHEQTFIFKDFDELGDTPMEFGNQVTFDFQAAGVLHHVAIYGSGNFDVDILKTKMAKLIEVCSDIWGENPNEEYWFIIHNLDHGSGGLEHSKSTTLSMNRWTYDEGSINDFLETMAHEYFHLWNVKRLRPRNLVKYNYNSENYTNMLWVMEGFTSYYAMVALLRADLITPEEFLRKYNSKLNWIEGMRGNIVQPVAMASYDAWIKAYMPNENSSNTTISYYSKGALIAGVMDAMILKASNGKKNLDDLMQRLYKKYYKQNNVGITMPIFKKELEDFTGLKLDDFFTNYISGTKTIPYAKYLSPLGIDVKKEENQYIMLGLTTYQSGGAVKVARVRSGSAAETAGISPGDEIIAFNGYRVDNNQLQEYFRKLKVGDVFNLLISRFNRVYKISAEMGTIKKVSYQLTYKGGNNLGDIWLDK